MRSLYIMECDGKYKIGTTNDVKKRLGQLQTGNPHKITISFDVEIGFIAGQLEIHLHKLFEEFHVNGEWFDLPHNVWDMLCVKLANLENALRAVMEMSLNSDVLHKEWQDEQNLG